MSWLQNKFDKEFPNHQTPRGRIEQAETALVLRARELFHVAGDNVEEGEALDDAMYALHALLNTSQPNRCMAHRSEAA